MTLKEVERRSRERLQISIPLRVLGFGDEHSEAEGFSEDTQTLLVSRSGASIILRSPVLAGDFLRIVNLTNQSEADFRVVGALGTGEDGVCIWAVECLERKDAFWGTECSPPSAENPCDDIALQCRACSSEVSYPLTCMELEVLGATGILILNCDVCGKRTYWVVADPSQRPNKFPVGDAVAPPERPTEKKNRTQRAAKRLALKLPILVQKQSGEKEVSTTVSISKLGLGVTLFMDLDVGETVKIVCPYDPSSGGIEQTAEVRWRSRHYNDDFPKTYGVRFIQ